MKFRNPKTGKVFEDIEKARTGYCAGKDCNHDCEIAFKRPTCAGWAAARPIEAAHLMGYEVVEGEQLRDTTKLPRICEVLGVEVGERFRVESCSESEFWVEDGALQCEVKFPFSWDQDTANLISVLLDAPEFIIRKPRFTEDEAAAIRVLYAAGIKHLTRNAMGELEGWTVRPEPAGDAWYSVTHNSQPLPREMFPSICPRQLVSLEDIVGQKENRPNEGAAIR